MQLVMVQSKLLMKDVVLCSISEIFLLRSEDVYVLMFAALIQYAGALM